MKTTTDVVIIGSRVIGWCAAYHLAQMGITDVAVFEMDEMPVDEAMSR